MKKIIMIFSIVCFILSGLLGLLFVTEIFDFSGVALKFFLTMLTFSTASLLSLNSVNMLNKKIFIMPIICLSLLCISSLLAIIQFWASISWGLFGQLTIIISVFSILFNYIVSSKIKLGKQKILLQILTYFFIVVFDIFIIIVVFNGNIFNNETILTMFIIDIIFSVMGIAILAIFSKQALPNLDINNNEYITISRQEYESMKEKIAKLEEQLSIK